MKPVTDAATLKMLNGPQPVQDPLVLGQLEHGIDFSQPVEAVRTQIAKLDPDKREAALKTWADAFVANERKAGGFLQGVTDAARNIARGTLVGSFLDEANAATSAGLHSLTGGYAGAPYDEAVAYQRATDRAIDKEKPVQSFVAKMAGGVASAVPMMAPAKSVLGATARGVGYGTTAGAVHGFGEGESTMSNRLDEAGKSAVIGAGIGAVLPGAAALATRGIGRAAEAVAPTWERIRRGPEEAADTILAQRMRSSGVTPAEVRGDLAEGQRVARYRANSQAELPEAIADTSDGMQRLLGSVYRAGGEAGDMVRNTLDARQRGPRNPYSPQAGEPPGQMATVMDAFDRALGVRSARSGYATERQLVDQARTQSRGLYDAAYRASEPFDLSGALSGMALTAQQYPPPFKARLLRAVNLFTHPQLPANNVQRFDNAKKALDDMIERAQRGGEGNLARELVMFKDNLMNAVHQYDGQGMPTRNVPYHEARSAWGSNAEMREAIEMGRRALMDASDVTVDAFRQLTPGQQQMFRIGMRDGVRRALGNKRPGSDVTQLFQQQRVQELMSEVIPQSRGRGIYADRAERFGEAMSRQERMVQTRQQAIGGSQTAQRQQDDAQFTGDALGQLYNRFRSNPSVANLAVEAIASGAQRLFGYRQDVAAALARRLLTTDRTEQNRILQRVRQKYGTDRADALIRNIDETARRLSAAAPRALESGK